MISWSYDGGNGGAGVLSVTIDFAVIGDTYILVGFDDDSSPDAHKATGTTETWTLTDVGNANPRTFGAFLSHGDTIGVSTPSDPVVACNIFLGGTASAGESYDAITGADWSYDSTTETVSVTFTGDGVTTYYIYANPENPGGWQNGGTFGPSAGTITASIVLSPVTSGKEFAAVLSNWAGDINGDFPDYADRLFVVGTTSSGNEGNPDAGGTPPVVTSYSPNHGCNGDTITITGSNFTGATAVKFNGVNATSFIVVDDNTITAVVPPTATTGGISVTTPGGTGVGPTFTIDPGPANDNYPTGFTPFFNANYYLGTNSGGCRDGTTRCATAQIGEPDPNGINPPKHSVWFTFESPFTGTLRVVITPTSAEMAGAVYAAYDYVTGPPSGLGAAIATGSSGSPNMDIPVVGGNDYVIQVDTLTTGHGGTFTIIWKEYSATPPANDDFANAINLSGLCGEITTTVSGASAECDEPLGIDDPDGPYNTVWYRWTPTYTGKAFIYFAGLVPASITFHDIDIDVFTGATLATLTEVASHEFRGTPPPGLGTRFFAFNITAGTTYYIRWQARGEDVAFHWLYETDMNNWQARTGTFPVGATSFNTGIGRTPKAVIFYLSGQPPDGTYENGWRSGVGCATTDGQWCSSFSYPWRIHDGINGAQYGIPNFDSNHAISMLDVNGAPYIQAHVISMNPDGIVEVAWDQNPSDGSWIGFFAIGGDIIETAIGTGSFVTSGTTTVTPGIGSRFFMVSGTEVFPGDSGAGLDPAQGWAWGGITEGKPNNTAWDASGAAFGILWFGGGNDEGDFAEASINFGAVTNDAATSLLGTNSSFKILNPPQGGSSVPWAVDYGWLAIGGCGFHTRDWTVERSIALPAYPTDFWTNAATWLGTDPEFFCNDVPNFLGRAISMGALDETDEQYDISNAWIDHLGGFGDFQTPVYRDAWQDRIGSGPGGGAVPHNTEWTHWISDLPGRPNLGGTLTQTGGDDFQSLGLFLFGNYFPPVPLGIVSFSHIKSSQRRAGLQIR